MEIRLLTFVATNAIINPRQAAILIAMRSPETSASQPITGGPMRKPKKLMLDTMVMAMLALTVPNWQTPVPVQNNKLPQPLACEPSRPNHSFEMSSYISFNMKLKTRLQNYEKINFHPSIIPKKIMPCQKISVTLPFEQQENPTQA